MRLKNSHVIFSQKWTGELCLKLGWLDLGYSYHYLSAYQMPLLLNNERGCKKCSTVTKNLFWKRILCYTPCLFFWQENEFNIGRVSVIDLATFL